MKRIVVLPLDFLGQGAMLQPADPVLHDLAIDFCRRELAKEINLAKLQKVWIAVEAEGEIYKAVIGLAGFVTKIDIPVFRVIGDTASRTALDLIERMRSYFQDNGARGSEVFVYVSSQEKPQQRCEKWQETLHMVGAERADRWLVKV